MNLDRVRWNEKYQSASLHCELEPDDVLRRCVHQLPGGGRVLDVACGRGDNANFLALRGFEVIGVDVSNLALALAQAWASARDRAIQHAVSAFWAVVDLDVFRPPAVTFDVVIVTRYLNRPLVPSLIEALTPGGVIFYRTFNQNFLRRRQSFNPEFVLRPGELGEWFSRLKILGSDESGEQSFCLARKPET